MHYNKYVYKVTYHGGAIVESVLVHYSKHAKNVTDHGGATVESVL